MTVYNPPKEMWEVSIFPASAASVHKVLIYRSDGSNMYGSSRSGDGTSWLHSKQNLFETRREALEYVLARVQEQSWIIAERISLLRAEIKKEKT